jgi:arginyl-tRNA synthetase
MYAILKEKLAIAISQASGCDLKQALDSLGLPKGEFGDIATSISFQLAKTNKKNPSEIALNLAGKIKLPDWVEHAKTTGPYINFILSNKFFEQFLGQVLEQKENFGKGKPKKEKVIIEYPSVNPNKPWHIGHLRNAILGDTIARILKFYGQKVERIDYIDDLGLQVAQSFWGYKNLGKKPAGKFDLWLGEQYVEIAKKFEEDENIQKQVRELLKKIEEGESKEAEECRKMAEKCVYAQYETAFKFNIYHDVIIFESDIVKTLFEEGIGKLKSNNSIVFEKEGKNAGCWVAKMHSEEFSKMESPDKVLIRSDGTATYTGKDVIFQLWKFGLLRNDFNYSLFITQPNGQDCFMSNKKGKKKQFGKANKVINVIGIEQSYPQKVIQEIIKGMGYEKQAKNSIHLGYEHVWLEDSKFSGRQGTWIGYTADELYSEGLVKSEGKIKPEITADQRGKIASAVAVGAIRFAFLKISPEKKIIFRWEDALSMEGDSGPYALYSYARAHKIFEKGGCGEPKILELISQEKELLKKLMIFEEIIKQAAEQLKPHIIVEYCLDLAAIYNKFYNACPIVSAQKEQLKQQRLAINCAFLFVMKNLLEIIGVEALEKM